MKKEIKSVRGMHDYFLQDINIWNYIEKRLKRILHSYCYSEIKLPIIEKTEIFNRTIGQVTDIIEKEMYSFYDRKGCSLTLRPEGTVGCVRAVIQNRLLEKKYHKFWYLGPMFRYERPQNGRYRQFYQLGGEVFGLNTEDIDLEIILLTHRMWKNLGIDSHLILEVNFIGSKQERLTYKQDLTSFLEKKKNFLDEDSKRRIYTNPLRVLDSKNQDVQKLLTHAPMLKEYISLDSYKYFQNLCSMMDYHKISYTHNAKLIRGLDYYNNTVFEWKSNRLGSQNTICAGGRYDSLFQEMGAPKTAAIGFAIGIERLILLIKSLNMFPLEKISIDIYIIFINEKNKNEAIILSEELRTLFPNLKIFIDFFQQKTKKKIKNAVQHVSNIAILIGIDKNKKDFFVLKDLKKIKEYYFSKHQLIEKLKIFFNKK